ncbi:MULTISPECIES: PASTA domain-containing protein [Streptomyces]|uniref:PASTA domain-containing protein n=1 Tax=Streptomyces TaxID=1883 RepID=UPI000C2805CA|nr:PASTA domain-containing protein [Streptomyces sp. CB01201]MBX7467215.1 PASTA domain-containing protein [Streptomyces sp. MAG02]PJN05130.1 hypothetical protein CG740_04590 [Streptomyces sp. CB01201]
MNHTRTAVIVLAAAGLLLAGCSSSDPAPAKTPGAAGSGSPCAGKKWPQAVPTVTGMPLADAVADPLLCFHITEAVAPDGHDALQDPVDETDWVITGSKPGAGTAVTQDQPVTLTISNPNN